MCQNCLDVSETQFEEDKKTKQPCLTKSGVHPPYNSQQFYLQHLHLDKATSIKGLLFEDPSLLNQYL